VIVGVNFDRPRTATALFVCAASASAGIFTVPSYVLQTVPASRPVYRQSNGYIMVGSIPTATTTISASGLDRGVAMTASFAAKSVVFR
jgi:K+-transporting ATPase c subunit